MKKAFRKYFIVSLSFLLILSNFSYATNLMLCEMAGDNDKCECSHNNSSDFNGISLSQEKTKCCEEKTTELSNSNTLLNNNSSQDLDLFVNLELLYISTLDPEILFNSTFRYFPQNSYHIRTDIPVFTSSLLI